MPLHDWTRVGDGAFRGFRTTWMVLLKVHLNDAILPEGFYADVDRVVGVGRRLAVRRNDHVTVARIELVSPSEGEFATKVADALAAGVHVVVLDILPVGRHDPDAPYRLPEGESRTFAAYCAGGEIDAVLQYPRVGQPRRRCRCS